MYGDISFVTFPTPAGRMSGRRGGLTSVHDFGRVGLFWCVVVWELFFVSGVIVMLLV